MILAAGRGERFRPFTDICPKPLIPVLNKPLIVWHLEKLKSAGFNEVVVNSAWLSHKIVSFLGDGSSFGLHITHSVEENPGLETAGGIIKALPYLGEEPFLVINGDVFLDADYKIFKNITLQDKDLGHLFLVKNPQHHLQGDFSLSNNLVIYGGDFTFSGVAIYKKEAFTNCKVERLPLRPFFDRWIANQKLMGSLLNVPWFDVGTLERKQEAERYLAK